MDIHEVLDGITQSDVEKAIEIKKSIEDSGVPWRTMVDGELWSLEDSRIVQTITYLRLNGSK